MFKIGEEKVYEIYDLLDNKGKVVVQTVVGMQQYNLIKKIKGELHSTKQSTLVKKAKTVNIVIDGYAYFNHGVRLDVVLNKDSVGYRVKGIKGTLLVKAKKSFDNLEEAIKYIYRLKE